MKISGIYKIQSQIKQERIYIGSAIDIKGRWRVHLHTLRNNKHHSKKLQRHYNKYSESDLIFIIIELCLPEFLIVREQYYLDTLKSYFNNCKIAGSPLGVKHSEENNRKNSERLKGRQFSIETRKKISDAKKGKKREMISDETRKKMSIVKIGHFVSDLTRKKIGDANRKRIISEITREKFRNRIVYNKGLKMSEEQKQKISKALTGRKRNPFSSETIRKMSESHKKYK